jgi:hypothetical protein
LSEFDQRQKRFARLERALSNSYVGLCGAIPENSAFLAKL